MWTLRAGELRALVLREASPADQTFTVAPQGKSSRHARKTKQIKDYLVLLRFPDDTIGQASQRLTIMVQKATAKQTAWQSALSSILVRNPIPNPRLHPASMGIHNPDRYMSDLRRILSLGRKRISTALFSHCPSVFSWCDRGQKTGNGSPIKN